MSVHAALVAEPACSVKLPEAGEVFLCYNVRLCGFTTCLTRRSATSPATSCSTALMAGCGELHVLLMC